MKRIVSAFVIFLAMSWGATAFFWGCSSSQKKPDPALQTTSNEETPSPPPPASGDSKNPIPALVGIPHPAGSDLGDVERLFLEKHAPDRETLKDCDQSFKKLTAATQSKEEIEEGAHELVRTDPVLFHWCFFSKILDLEKLLKKDAYLDERQKTVLETFAFLSPIAQGYRIEFRDSRYLRWAVSHYRKLSETVFFRRVELNPEMTSTLVQAENPFEGWRAPAAKNPILEKYKIILKPEAPTRVYPTPDSTLNLSDTQAIDPNQEVKKNLVEEK